MRVRSDECGVRNDRSGVCPHFGVCGGCAHQDVAYERQLAVKEGRVRAALASLPVEHFHPILASAQTAFYRNKMEYSFGDERDLAIINRQPAPEKGGRVHLGLHPKGRFALVTPTPECGLQSLEARIILKTIGDWATDHQAVVYVRTTNEGDLRHVVIREGKNTGERLVNLVAKTTTTHVDDLARRLKNCGVPITTFLWSRYDGLSDVARSDDQRIYWGDGSIQEKLDGVVLKVNANSFMQTNTQAAAGMITVLKSWIGRSPFAGPPPRTKGVFYHAQSSAIALPAVVREGSTLIDLYCGSGAIGLSLAGEFESVIGVELNSSAIADARQNALVSETRNIRFIEGKAEEIAGQLPVGANASNTMVIVDPPRPGLHPAMTKMLLEWSVPWLFYVSCNPESLARDLQALRARYDILDAQSMDFFPHTDHIETAVRLRIQG